MRRIIKQIIFSGKGATVTPWYLSTGIAAADIAAIYQPIGAASYAASKVNLAHPGTFQSTLPARGATSPFRHQ
jgi:hypothetical protein